jgi:flagellar L-ring protein precursor FlgH
MNTTARAALMLALMAPLPVMGQLPGLPAPPPSAPAAPAAESGENQRQAPEADARTGEPKRPAVVAQQLPVRGSLFAQGTAAAAPMNADGQPLAGPTPVVSMIAVTPPPAKKYHKNDLITIIIREDSQATTNGKGDAKKSQDFDFGLEQFLQLGLSASGIPTLGSTQNSNTMPKIKFKYSNDRKSDASQERQDSLSARISAMVVDVKPNGTLVVEAVKQIIVDKEEQVFKLSGICRAEDITVDNTLLSTQLADLSLSKQTKGEVRDSTKRGWLNKFIDKASPF